MQPKLFTSIVVVALLLGCGVPAFAQSSPSVVPGSRVRVTAPALGLAKAVGVLADTTGGSIKVVFKRVFRTNSPEGSTPPSRIR